jgi:hypothetical protein
MNEKQIENIKEKIRKLRAQLAAEKKRFGGYFDNRGIRYDLPELYLKLGDYKGAMTYFRWFSREFSDDVGFPFFLLFWSFTHYKNKHEKDAVRLAYRTAFSNTYLIDLLCGKPVVSIDKAELGGSETLKYAEDIAEWCNSLITKDFKTWLCSLHETEEFRSNLNRFISLQKLIKDEDAYELRSRLIDEVTRLREQLTERDDD